MITAKLYGGLGNQMFQISTAYSLSKDNNDICAFNFNDCQTLLQGNSSKKYIKNIFKNLNEIYDYNSFKNFYKETQFSFVDITYKENLIIDGYFQSYKYFEEKFHIIYQLLRIEERKKEVLKKLDSVFKNNLSNSISMHFRLGDYKKFAYFHPILPSSYYGKSIQIILEKNKDIEIKNIFYFCEEEDLETVEQTILYCKNLFPNLNFIRIPNNFQDWEQMLIMSECKHHIIANSSFSWWGAYIGYQTYNQDNQDNPNKLVCYPSLWFVPTAKENTKDLYPTDWIKIEV